MRLEAQRIPRKLGFRSGPRQVVPGQLVKESDGVGVPLFNISSSTQHVRY